MDCDIIHIIHMDTNKNLLQLHSLLQIVTLGLSAICCSFRGMNVPHRENIRNSKFLPPFQRDTIPEQTQFLLLKRKLFSKEATFKGNNLIPKRVRGQILSFKSNPH